MQFCNSIVETLFHSIWQTGLLYAMYFISKKSFIDISPFQKRNFLYNIILIQLLLSSLTFYSIYNNESIAILNIFSIHELADKSFLLSLQFSLTIVYFSYVTIKFSQLIYQWIKFRHTNSKKLQKVNAYYKTFTEQKAFQLGIKRKINIWFSENIKSPITFGFFKPIILLPVSILTDLSAQNIEAIIIHELTHIKNKDYLLNWILVVMEIIFAFNPFIKKIINEIKLEREKNCDVQVINFNYNALSYAESLLLIAQSNQTQNKFELSAATNNNHLLKRIQYFTSAPFTNNRNKTAAFFWTFVVVFFVAIIQLLPIKTNNELMTVSTQKIAFVVPEYRNTLKFNNKYQPTFKKFEKELNLSPIQKEEKRVLIEPSNIETITPLIDEENIFKQVSLIDTLQNVKEFIYNIETPEGKIIQSYKLVYQNNEWVLEPLWVSITKNKRDTLSKIKIDSLSDLIYNIQ